MSADSPERLAQRVRDAFERIHREQMAGLPLLNNALSVATLGFQALEDRMLGMLVTPWMMGVLLFPSQQDHQEPMALGSKHQIGLPGGYYPFLANVIDGLGTCLMHSVHSPMHPFRTQEAALAEATTFLNKLLIAPPGGVPRDPVDAELLGKILRGEKVPELDTNAVPVAQRPSRPRDPQTNLTETT